jgi:hypothetical protein
MTRRACAARHKSAACAGAAIAASDAAMDSTQIETSLIIAKVRSRNARV